MQIDYSLYCLRIGYLCHKKPFLLLSWFAFYVLAQSELSTKKDGSDMHSFISCRVHNEYTEMLVRDQLCILYHCCLTTSYSNISTRQLHDTITVSIQLAQSKLSVPCYIHIRERLGRMTPHQIFASPTEIFYFLRANT